ncbi:MAG: hypothetical protein KDA60_19965 [Planctomycetales bacterium]|nr:hypothetical protein [Planctomycetales bacterium]
MSLIQRFRRWFRQPDVHSRDLFSFLQDACPDYVESLESRVMLAGNVQAVLTSGGDLRITGDNASNHIVLGQSVNGDLAIRALSNTTVNGDAFITFTGFRTVPDDLLISMRGGDDLVEIIDIQVEGSMRVNLGLGDDTLGARWLVVQDNASIVGGTGDDLISFVGTAFHRNFRLSAGAGDDAVYFADTNLVAGNTTILAGSGDDAGIFVGGTHEGRVSVNTGSGFDGLYVGTMSLPATTTTRFVLGSGDDIAALTSTSQPVAGRLIGSGGADFVAVGPGATFGMTTASVETLQLNEPLANTTTVIVVVVMQERYVSRGGSPSVVL